MNSLIMERGRRIELLALAWKAKVLPLYEPRIHFYWSVYVVLPHGFKLPKLVDYFYLIHCYLGGEGWIRTIALLRTDLQSVGIGHSPTSPNLCYTSGRLE
jgi:hypothetical protein